MQRVMRLAALNIVTQPHDPETYRRLLSHVYERRRAGRIRGDRFGTVALIQNPGGPANDRHVDGIIGAFTKINEDSDWINVSTGQLAGESELAEIRIPGGLQPNAIYHHFRFYLDRHILVFEIGNGGAKLTPSNASKLFERMFATGDVFEEFGEVNCTIFPSKESVQRILQSPALCSIRIVAHAPNPDDGHDAEVAFQQRLEQMVARRMDQQVYAKKGGYLRPDEELKTQAQIGSTNGLVEATLDEGGRRIKVSTEETPFVYTHEYTDQARMVVDEFRIAAERVVQTLDG